MNEGLSSIPPWDVATEARIVSQVLGEASAFEEAELERLVARWPEMRLLKLRFEVVHELLGNAAESGDSWVLPQNLRDRLLQSMAK